MYNKIASLILNSGKAAGLSDVFIAQPDALKENLAGKVFVLAEIGGKKTDGRKIFNFLIAAINDNYYNDEKILWRDKIEGLKIENIFEAALTKTNKNLADFLLSEKIKINPAAANLTLGVIYENKLHFSSFGRNRCLLIYSRGEEYEIINVEANAVEAEDNFREDEAAATKTPKLFSSVISGEVPLNSYFIFTSEAMPEYLSGKEMINIVTKLPPIAAAEQIKNALGKINTYVPFLGIIIKNTTGLTNLEIKEEKGKNLPAYGSISFLDYTEQKTEQMLAPAGLINFSKIFKTAGRIIKSWRPKPAGSSRRYFKSADKAVQTALDIGTVKSLNLARSDSFLIKEKIFFKKKSGWLAKGFKKIFSGLTSLFNLHFWTDFGTSLKIRIKGLNQKNRLLLTVGGGAVLIFIFSLLITSWSHQRQIARDNFNNLMAQIEDKENLIYSHLLYNDDKGAETILIEAQAVLSSLPQKTKDQQATYQRLADKLRDQEEKIQKIVRVDSVKVNDLSGLEINNLVFAAGQIYGAANQFIYGLTPNSASSTKNEISGAANLSNPQFNKDLLYYWNNNQIAQFNIKTKANNVIKVTNLDQSAGLMSFKIFNGNLYLIAKNKNQIYRYIPDKSGFSVKSDWLKEAADLSQASDLAIDGDIYILKNNGEVLKFFKGKKVDYAAAALSPVMTGASKIIAGAKYIYIFEADSKRLAVLDKKDGHLMNQYIVNSLNQPKDFTVDEDGKAAYFLDGEAVYKIGLNQ